MVMQCNECQQEKTLWKSGQGNHPHPWHREGISGRYHVSWGQRDSEVRVVTVVAAGLGVAMGKRVLSPWKGLAKAQSCHIRVVSWIGVQWPLGLHEDFPQSVRKSLSWSSASKYDPPPADRTGNRQWLQWMACLSHPHLHNQPSPLCESSTFSAHPSWTPLRHSVKGRVRIGPNQRATQNIHVCKGTTFSTITHHPRAGTCGRFPALYILYILLFRGRYSDLSYLFWTQQNYKVRQ